MSRRAFLCFCTSIIIWSLLALHILLPKKEKMGQVQMVNAESDSDKAFGHKQSPIDIRHSDAVYESTLDVSSFEFNYLAADCGEIINTGSSWTVLCSQNAQSTLTAGHLPGTYRLAQFHCHWSSNSWNGSEHTVLGKGFAGELHFVHWNTKYGNFQSAVQHPDGIAVVAVFLDEGPLEIANENLDVLMPYFAQIRHKSDRIKLEEGFDPSTLMPDKKEFWTYYGSLTTPPYTECVLWTVFKDPITVSYTQLKVFRNLLPSNVRPVQKPNERQIKSSFELGGKVLTTQN